MSVSCARKIIVKKQLASTFIMMISSERNQTKADMQDDGPEDKGIGTKIQTTNMKTTKGKERLKKKVALYLLSLIHI